MAGAGDEGLEARDDRIARMPAPREREIGRRTAVQRAEAQDGVRAAAPMALRAQELVELAPIAFPFADETLYLHDVQYEDRITIPTPEGVELELTLAGLGSRAVAGAVDLILKLLLVGMLLTLLLGALGSAGVILILPAIGLSMLAYDVAFEVLADGRTPGKRGTGLRVVRSSGRRVDFMASMIRNLVRLVDGYPLGFMPTVVSILVTRRNQRLGDLAADTVVVRDRRAIDLAGAGPGAPRTRGDPFGAGPRWDVSAVGRTTSPRSARSSSAARSSGPRRARASPPARWRSAPARRRRRRARRRALPRDPLRREAHERRVASPAAASGAPARARSPAPPVPRR